MIGKTDWQAAYHDLIAAGRDRLGEPPGEEELLAWSRGELSPEEAARVRELLVYYPELVRALEEPLPFPYDGKPGDPDFLSDQELARDWASLEARLPGTAAAAAAPGPDDSRPPPASAAVSRLARGPRLRYWRLSAAAAALLAVVFGGLFLRAQSDLRRALRELREPRTNLEHRLLLPDGRRGAAGQPPIPLPSEADYFLLIPALIDQPEFPDYRLEVLDAGATPPRMIWSGSGLRRRSDDTFEIWVPRAFLRPGEYRLVLYGLDRGRQQRLATYTIRLAASAA